MKDVDKGVRSCECGVDCEETGYEKEISFSLWPSQKYEVIYINMRYTNNMIFVNFEFTEFTTLS